MEKTSYHVIMLSGGQLRHYEQYAIDHSEAYKLSVEIDRNDYPNKFTDKPDATVINREGVAMNFFMD